MSPFKPMYRVFSFFATAFMARTDEPVIFIIWFGILCLSATLGWDDK